MQGRAAGLKLLTGFILFVSGSSDTLAQCGTSATFTGSLRVKNQAGCVPLTVQASSDLVGVQNVRYVYEYDGKREIPVTTSGTYTYKKPGQYQILQLSEKEGLPLRACGTVIVYDTLPPKVELTACGSKVTLRVTDLLTGLRRYDYLLVRWGDSRLDTLKTNPAVSVHTFSDNAPRRIQVQGVHQYGQCGGTTVQSFVPDQRPDIRALTLTNPQAAQLSIDNLSGVPLLVEQAIDNGEYQPLPVTTTGTLPTVSVTLDPVKETCFRVVPSTTCPGQLASAPYCYTPPLQPEPPTTPINAVYLPDAFSPNSDGINDTFGPIGTLSAGTYQLTVFDRWGRVVFTTDTLRTTWDGSYDERPVAAGTYAYRLEIRSTGGQTEQRRGHVQLIR